MDSLQTILEIAKYVLPSLVVLIACNMLVNRFLATEMRRKQIELLQGTHDTTLRLRLQAYERLIVFVERIQPRQLLSRIYNADMTVRDLQQAAAFSVRSEFEYNLSQQLYVSKSVWETVRNVTEQEINMVNQIAKQLKPDAPAKELHTRIMEYLLTAEGEMPTDIARQVINDEAKKVLS
jgi:hypothetical protein